MSSDTSTAYDSPSNEILNHVYAPSLGLLPSEKDGIPINVEWCTNTACWVTMFSNGYVDRETIATSVNVSGVGRWHDYLL